MKTKNIIGRFFAEEWQLARDNRDAFYIPEVSELTPLAELQSIKAQLTQLVDYWNNQVISNTAWEAIANAQAIADLEQGKLNVVNNLIAAKGGDAGGGTTTPPTETKKNWFPLLAVVLLGVYFLAKNKKRAA